MSEHKINYTKIYFTLLALLVVSVAGPFIGIKWVTLVTAFGIALVKANLVIQNFMHIRVEKSWIKWMLSFSILMILLLFYGVAPDVMRHEGLNWTNVAAQAAVERGIPDGEHEEEAEHVDGEGASAAETDHDEDAALAVADASDFDAAGSYATYCASCHGATGEGDGVVGAALDPKPADFSDPTFWDARDDDQVALAIREGGVAVSRSASMPPWGSVLDEAQAAAMVEYLKAFQTGG